MHEPKEKISRRRFLGRLGLAAGAGLILPAARFVPAPACADDELVCDVSGLTDKQKQTRKALGYVDKSTARGKQCDNCQFFVAAEAEGQCGTCKVVPGPIHPKGYCTAWAARTG